MRSARRAKYAALVSTAPKIMIRTIKDGLLCVFCVNDMRSFQDFGDRSYQDSQLSRYEYAGGPELPRL